MLNADLAEHVASTITFDITRFRLAVMAAGLEQHSATAEREGNDVLIAKTPVTAAGAAVNTMTDRTKLFVLHMVDVHVSLSNMIKRDN